jgi:ATP-dependent DNA ligase
MNEETLNLMLEYQKSLLRRIAELETELNTKNALKKLSSALNPTVNKDHHYVLKAFEGNGTDDVSEQKIIETLQDLLDFNDEYCHKLIKKAMHEGLIYERRTGMYAKA